MRPLLLSFLVLTASAAGAQELDTLTVADGWRSTLVGSLTGSQATYSNWQEGGIDAVSATAALDGSFDRVVGRVLTTQTLRLAYGVLQQDTLDVRKALDVVRYEAAAELNARTALRPAGSFSLRTQFAPGYDFSPSADRYPTLAIEPGEPLKVSDAFAPLVLNQSAGMAWRPGGGVFGRFGVGLKETVVAVERLRPVYGNAPDEAVRVQAGVDVELGVEREVMDNVTLRSRLFGFQAFNQVGDDAPDVLFENLVRLTVNDLLDVRVNADVFYDADVSEDVQLREVLSVGLSYAFL